jgi:hypothetical protein
MSINPEILSVVYRRQNPEDSAWTDVARFCTRATKHVICCVRLLVTNTIRAHGGNNDEVNSCGDEMGGWRLTVNPCGDEMGGWRLTTDCWVSGHRPSSGILNN